MDPFDYRLTGRLGSSPVGDGYGQKVDGAVGQTIRHAIRDATQTADPALQQEAAAWLWICCPDIADQVDLPELQAEAIPALTASYVVGDPGI